MKKYFWGISGILLMAVVAVGQQVPLSLDDCINMARQTHPAIQAAEMGRMSAIYEKRSIYASALPSFTMDYSHTWMNVQPSMTIPGTALTPAMTLPAGSKEIDKFTVTVTQPLFVGGAVIHGLQLARHMVTDAEYQYDIADQEIVYQTRSAYYGVLKAKEFVEVTRQAVEMAESLRQRAKDFYDVGMVAKDQLLEAEVNLAQSRQDQTSAKSALAIAKAGLNILIGHPTQDDIEVAGRLEKVPFGLSMEECVQTGLRERPEMLDARTKADMAGHLVAIQRSYLFPGVYAVGQYEHQEGIFGSPPDQSTFTLAASWAFFEWGKKYYKVKSAQEVHGQAIQNVRLTEDQITLQVKQSYLKLREAESNIDTARAAITSADENLRVVKAKFDQNMATSFDVLTAQTYLTRARTSEVIALADYMTARAALDRAMGVKAPSHGSPSASNYGTTTINPASGAPENTPPAQPVSPAANEPAALPATGQVRPSEQ